MIFLLFLTKSKTKKKEVTKLRVRGVLIIVPLTIFVMLFNIITVATCLEELMKN